MEKWKFLKTAVYLFSTKQKNSEGRSHPWSLDVGTGGSPTCVNNGESGSGWEMGASPSSAFSQGPFDLCGALPLTVTSWDQTRSPPAAPSASSGTQQGRGSGSVHLLPGPQPE